MADFIKELEEKKRKEEEEARKRALKKPLWGTYEYRRQKRMEKLYEFNQKHLEEFSRLKDQIQEYIVKVNQLSNYKDIYNLRMSAVTERIEIFVREGGYPSHKMVEISPLGDELEVCLVLNKSSRKIKKKYSVHISKVTNEHISDWVKFAVTGQY